MNHVQSEMSMGELEGKIVGCCLRVLVLREAHKISGHVILVSEEVPRFYCGCLCHLSPDISTIEKYKQL